jgi:Domain of unknown function (DUF4249)
MNMKTILKTLIFSTLIFAVSSCEDVVQIKLDEGSKLYVIDAFVNNLKSEQKIRVVTNDTYFSNREAPPVTNAVVVLKDLTINKQYSFFYTTNGYYSYLDKINDTLARTNHQYELNVTVDGVTYTSLATQKRTASIDSISAEYNDGTNGGIGRPREPYYNCFLYAKDKTDALTDYYWVKTFRNDTLFAGSGDINVSIDGTNGPVNLPVDSTDFTPPIVFIGFKDYPKKSTCKVEIHSISRETYFFFVQASSQINNGGLFATTPENVKSNIITPKDAKVKAIGWFNMASVASKTKVIPSN